MAEQTFIACPLCAEPIVMSPMQLDIYRGRALTCARCARQFTVDPTKTPLYALSDAGGARLVNPKTPDGSAGEAPAVSIVRNAPSPSTESAGAGSSLPKRRAAASGWKLVVAIVGGFLLIAGLASVLIVTTLRRAEEETNRARCVANFIQINAAIQAYARTNQGRFPDSLERLIATQSINPAMLVCPSTSDTPATGSTSKPSKQGGHDSYVYVGQQLTIGSVATQTPKPVALYEPLSNHQGDGSTVLYADGVVAFVERNAAGALIARLQRSGGVPPATQPGALSPAP